MPTVKPNHETMVALVLSTVHIKRDTSEMLDAAHERARLAWQYGTIVHIPEKGAEDQEDPDPADLLVVFDYCREHGYEWVRFDCDGPEIADLPTYEESWC